MDCGCATPGSSPGSKSVLTQQNGSGNAISREQLQAGDVKRPEQEDEPLQAGDWQPHVLIKAARSDGFVLPRL